MEQKAKNVSPFSNESRNAYVVEHLTSSMLALLEEKPITEISISELCDMAGVGRTSFYRNYENKEDIVKKYIEHLFQDWLGKYKMAVDLSIREKVRIVFAHFEANRDFYSLLNERGLVYLLKDIMLDPSAKILATSTTLKLESLCPPSLGFFISVTTWASPRQNFSIQAPIIQPA